MRQIFLLAGAAALAIGAPALAQGKGGNGGNGNGQGGEHGAQHGGGAKAQGQGNRGGGEIAKGQERKMTSVQPGRNDKASPAKAERGPDRAVAAAGKANRNEQADSRAMKDFAPGRSGQAKGPDNGKGPGNSADLARGNAQRAAPGNLREAARVVATRRWDGGRYRYDDSRYLVPVSDSCPPGLARKNNGCLPPGQARKLAPTGGWSGWYPTRYFGDGYDWRYDNGYLYRLGNGGLVSAFVPLLGGALFGGNIWPSQYTSYEVPAYYDRFYGYDDDYDYRYAQNAIFAVDPETQQIEAIAGLLTGDPWSVGQAMPLGYDIYNVPPAYRDRYVDGPDAMYRYSDGYVYEVDPTTQLVRAVIELLV